MHTVQQNLLDGLRLDASGVPIYVQLRDQLLRAIGAGALAPGDQMPTMRQVAVALTVDLNTVRHAYDELERAGVIRLERGRGSFVARPVAPAQPTDTARLETLASQTLALARAAGVDPTALAQRIVALAQSQDTTP
ncbi:MAG: GntR family transcriptional regulator [Caulobacteraceae bacterium]